MCQVVSSVGGGREREERGAGVTEQNMSTNRN